jgi:hypothetical protein
MMKKLLLTICVLCISVIAVHAQHFDDYFVDKTLRINYLHIGNKDVEQMQFHHFTEVNHWNGTRSQLVEPYHYGDILIEVLDPSTQKMLFSRSYSCLFTEYRTTERGETEIARMEESVNMPMPKQPVRVRFTSFDRRRMATVLKDTMLDPATLPMEKAKKEYAVMNLHKGNSPQKAIDILFIPDGYAKSDAKIMRYDMKRFAKYVMNCTPYKENRRHVNIRAIKGFSEQSGITQPQNDIYVKTLLNCTYNALDLDRYLMCPGVWNLHDVADDAPYDAIIIICNSEKYGGGGIYNFYCTVYNHGQYPDYVVVHEMGHLIGGLADEYYTSEVSVQDFYPDGVEPTEPNLTTLVDFESKWVDKVESGTPIPTPPVGKNDPNYNRIGVYEGGGYVAKGVYRPTLHCTMNSISYNDFCPICKETLEKVIRYYSK